MNIGAPLQGGTLNEIPPNATQQIQIATINDVIRRLNGLLKSQVYSDDTNKRMIIGFQKDGWGPGKDFVKMDIETWLWSDGSTNRFLVGRDDGGF
jgi:hypothetical protein